MPDNGKPTVLVMTSTFPRWPGDVQPGFVFELCRRLAGEVNIIVLAPHDNGAREHEEIERIEIIRFRYGPVPLECLAGEGGILTRVKRRPWRALVTPLFLLGQYLALRKILREKDIDLIHAHWLIPQGLIAALGGNGLPLLVTSHGADLFALNSFVFLGIKRYVIKKCSALTVVSSAMKHRLEHDRLSHNKDIFVLPMGTDLATRFIPPPVKPPEKSIIFVGRLVEKKGIKYLVEAFHKVKQKHPDAILSIAGSGPDEPSIRKQIALLGLQENITLVGHVDHSILPEYYGRHAIAVVPSVIAKSGDQEGLGLVIVEALGCGCAVVASDLIAIRDIIINGETGLLCTPGDPSDIAARLISLLDNPDMAGRLARRGRDHVLKNFDWSSIGPEYAGLITRLAGTGIARE